MATKERLIESAKLVCEAAEYAFGVITASVYHPKPADFFRYYRELEKRMNQLKTADFNGWPQSPGVVFLHFASVAYLDLAYEFAMTAESAVTCARVISLGVPCWGNLPSSVSVTARQVVKAIHDGNPLSNETDWNDHDLGKWLAAAADEIKTAIPLGQIYELRRDLKSMMLKINAEAGQVLTVDKPKGGRPRKPETNRFKRARVLFDKAVQENDGKPLYPEDAFDYLKTKYPKQVEKWTRGTFINYLGKTKPGPIENDPTEADSNITGQGLSIRAKPNQNTRRAKPGERIKKS
jgi:hypothetical protein